MRGEILAAALAAAAVMIPASAVDLPAEPSGADLRRDAVVRVVEKARPAVVNINAEEETVRVNPFFGPGDTLFDRYFRDFFESGPQRERRERSLGSGVIIDPGGYILTNEHVVARTSRIRISLADERTFEARIVGSDPDHDLAVLKVDAPSPLPSVSLGQSENLMIGEKVIAIGNPFGLSHTVTTGVVSATRRSIRTGRGRVYYDFIQTDAAINPGNSGGPLLNIAGELVGINTAIYAEGDGIGFAIPAGVAHRVVDDLMRYGEVRPVWLGMAVGRGRPGRRGDDGVVILRLLPGGGAEKAGLEVGDIILGVGRDEVRSAGEFLFRVGHYSHGDIVPLKVRRGKRIVEFIVRAEVPGERAAAVAAWDWLGISVAGDRHGLLVRSVRKGSPSDAIGLRAGDRILEVEGEGVEEEGDFGEELLGALQQGKVILLVQRGRYGYYVTLKVAGSSNP